MYEASTTGMVDEKKVERYQVESLRRLFFRIDNRSFLTAYRPKLRENNVTHRASFDEWCNKYAFWADCPFFNFCQRVQEIFNFGGKRCCYKCQVISDKLYNDKSFVDFIDSHSEKSDNFLRREIDKKRIAYLSEFDKKNPVYLAAVKISKDNFQMLGFKKPDSKSENNWPVLDENLKVVNSGFSDSLFKDDVVKVESLDIANRNKSGIKNDVRVDNSVTTEHLSSEENVKNNNSDSVEITDDGAQKDDQISTKEQGLITFDKNSENDSQEKDPIPPGKFLSEDSENSASVSQPEKKEDDKIEPEEAKTFPSSEIGERDQEEKIHDTRSFFYLSSQGGADKTEPKRMTTAEACALALKKSIKKGEVLTLFKITKSEEKTIDWTNHYSVLKSDLPDFVRVKKAEKITPSVIKKAESTPKGNEKPLFGARYFRLEWPGGSLGPKQMFVPDACDLAFQKAEEVGDSDKVKLFKVTLKNGKEKEFNWSGRKIKSKVKQETETSKGVGVSISIPGKKKDVKARKIKISGNFSFNINIDID